MTEADWLACDDVGAMLKCFPPKATARKLRLFGVACCRRLRGLDELSRHALDIAERYAQGLVGPDTLGVIRREVDTLAAALEDRAGSEDSPEAERAYHAGLAVVWAAMTPGYEGEDYAAAHAAYYAGRVAPGLAERQAQARLFADVLLVPPGLTVPPAWLAWDGGTVTRLARSVEERQAFDRLPILADALEDAGCAEQAILDHCRGPGPHARGCWLLDLLLGRS